MRPDPGRDRLEAKLASMSRDERALVAADLRTKGIALVWDQLDRAGPMEPVERMMFLIDRLYPEMPAAHRATLQRKFQAELDAGRWRGPVRPEPASQPGVADDDRP